MKQRGFSIVLFVAGLALLVVGFALQGMQPTFAQDEPGPLGEPPVFLAEYYDAWVTSAHAQFEDEAFVRWDADGEIPDRCAKCHSTPGYQDFLGIDGSEFGVVNAPAPIGTVVNCDACHNAATATLTSVTFPSGVEITGLADDSRCMLCHQGRSSMNSVNSAIEEAGLTEDPNAVSPDLRFINIHYYAAAASLYGSEVHGGYEFEGKSYQMRNEHVEGYDTCFSCHNPHTLELQVNECSNCHEGVESVEDLASIRMPGSLVDYDGDGDIEEGVAGEIETLQAMLYEAIQMYAANVSGTPIIYDSHSHPYFFVDSDGNGEIDAGEPVPYNAFTARLLQATYNYQVSLKDPGGYAHNPKYHIQLLFDSIEVLNQEMGGEGVDLSTASRDSLGHFMSSAEAFRHWDAEGEVPGSCSKCHTSEGLPFFLEHGVTIGFEPSNSLSCTTCHDASAEFALYSSPEVTFPSGAVLSFGEDSTSNMCLNCHQGRESTVSVNAAIARSGAGDDEISDALNFRNPHYFAAGATLFGTEAKGAYEFEGMEYNGRFEHTRRFDECADCHEQHTLELRVEECMDCHEVLEDNPDVELIRAHPDDAERFDYDGDGDMDEPIAAEVESFESALFVTIQVYAAETLGTPIAYAPHAYPYWYADTNANGEADEDEVNYDNRYAQWSPNLLRAAYNYQYVAKDPGAFAHNADYAMQVLYDSIMAIGGEDAVASFFRPYIDYYE